MRANLVIKRGLYYVVITYKDENDITKKKWFGTGLSERGNKRKAEEMKAKFLLDFERSLNKKKSPAITSKTLFADYIEDWLERTKLNLQVSTYSSYKQQVQKIANYFREKNILLSKLQPMDISNYYKYLQDNGKSIQLCEHYHVNIRKSLQSALKAGLIDYNPADRIDRPKSPKTVAKYYDVDQLETLFKCLEGDRFAYIYEITAYYGLRRSEMVGLKWENVDFKNNIINLKHSVVQTRLNGKSIIVKKDRMKNQSSLRSLPLLPVVKEILLEQKKIQENNKRIYGSEYENKYADYICVDDLGYLVKPDTVSARFKTILEKNNLPKITYHELRHSCASLLLSKGVGMKEIQEWLGHSTYNTTADIYSHLSYSSKIGVANAINNVFGDKNKTTLKDNQLSEEDRKEKLESIVPVKVKSYSHRSTTKTQEFDLSQVSPELKYEENMESDLDEELKELEELIKQRKQILKKKMDIEM